MWVLSASMERKVEGTHTEFLQQITGKQEQRLGYRTWKTTRVERVREAAGTKLEMTYIGTRQVTVAQFRVRRRRSQDGGLVAPRGNREKTLVHLGRNIERG